MLASLLATLARASARHAWHGRAGVRIPCLEVELGGATDRARPGGIKAEVIPAAARCGPLRQARGEGHGDHP